MKRYSYTVSTSTIWTSFDYGEIEADNELEARKKAIAQLRYDFDKANESLAHCDNTKGFSIHFNDSEVQIKLLQEAIG
jgi:hypothetical protein